MKLSRALPSGRSLVAEVDETLESLGRELLARLGPRADTMHAGETAIVDIDWATLRLRADSRTVVVEEPDYPHNPAGFVPSVTLTSIIFSEQRRVLRTLDVEGQPVEAQQYVRVSSDAMQAISVVGYRQAETETIFSGWEIILATSSGDETRGLYTMRELASRHLVWFIAMNLPTGWAFRFAGNTLMDCVSPANLTHQLVLSVDL